MRLVIVGIFLTLASTVMVGCGSNCQAACNYKYNISECSVLPPGWGDRSDELIQMCIAECENALEKPGDVGSYDPDDRNTSGEAVTLENERQAALWMDCILESACERIEQGYCAGP